MPAEEPIRRPVWDIGDRALVAAALALGDALTGREAGGPGAEAINSPIDR